MRDEDDAFLQQSFPEMLISVQELDGKPLAEQATVYANASIIMQAHGAALGVRLWLTQLKMICSHKGQETILLA